MARKRKSAPQKVDEAKRQKLAWNMADIRGQDVIHLIDDDEPIVIDEQEVDRPSTSAANNREEEPVIVIDENQDDIINDLINSSDVQLILHKELPYKEGTWNCCLGEFRFDISEFGLPLDHLSDMLSGCASVSLYMNISSGVNIVCLEHILEQGSSAASCMQMKTYYKAVTDTPLSCFEHLKLKAFTLKISHYDSEQAVLAVGLYITDTTLTRLKFTSDGGRQKKINIALQHVMAFFYDCFVKDYECGEATYTQKHDIYQVFQQVKAYHDAEPVQFNVNVQHHTLVPRLRDYQKQAVRWMLAKEQTKPKSGTMHQLYEKIVTFDGKELYYNRHWGALVLDAPEPPLWPPGGIIADEMGLGKTVEVLACMLAHPRTNVPQIEALPVLLEEDENESNQEEEFPQKADDLKLKHDNKDEDTFPNDIQNDIENKVAGDTENNHDSADIRELKDKLIEKISEFNDLVNKSGHEDGENEESEDKSVPSGDIDSENVETSVELFDKVMSPHMIDHDYICKRRGSGDSISKRRDSAKMKRDQSGITGQNTDESNVKNSEDVLAIPGSSKRNSSVSFVDVYEESTDETENVEIKCSDEEIEEGKPEVDERLPRKSRHGKRKGKSKLTRPKSSKRKRKISRTASTPAFNDSSKQKGKLSRNSSVSTINEQKQGKGKSKGSTIKSIKSEPVIKTENEFSSHAESSKTAESSQGGYFECICGIKGEGYEADGIMRVQCGICGLWQHADCVHYDLNDPYRGVYRCPHCHAATEPIPSGATLIISPSTICHQWVEEIQKHIRKESMKMFVYTGVNKQGFIQPQTLASQDIVITTYECLRKEIDYVDLPHTNSEHGRRFRNPKRFMAVPSPIVAVEWWRICLDEAQMVECTTTKTAEMALRLSAVNRWCVTGTPIQRGIADLYGLLLFLGIDPYWVKHWWSTLLYDPFCYGDKEPLYKVLSQVLWRTAKNDVLDQICLPPQSEEIHWLNFSPVEEHFYKGQYQHCANDALQKLNTFHDMDTKLSNLDKYTLHKILLPLLRLRQACCHPQAVRGEFIPIHKSTMTMEELLTQLIKKTKTESEEAHRLCVAARNGLVALHIIKDELPEAVDCYREVLRSIEHHKDKIRTDELQQLHTLYNLREILQRKPKGVAPTLRDDQLNKQIGEIKEKYMVKAAAFVAQAQDQWAPVHRSLTQQERDFRGGKNWWSHLLEWVRSRGEDDVLVARVKEDLADNASVLVQSMANRFHNIVGFEYVLAVNLEQLQKSHEKVSSALRGLSGHPSRDVINRTVECCLRPTAEVLKKCPFCGVDKLFEDYESKLFSFVDKGVAETTAQEDPMYLVNTRRQGTWADSETEKALRALIHFCRVANRDLLSYGQLHIKLFESLKKEFKCLRKVFMAQKEHVAAFDELDMATTRLRMRLPEEPKTDPPQPNIIEPGQFNLHRIKLLSDKVVNDNGLKRKLGQLLYLENLAKCQTSLEGGENPEPCPICHKELGKKWSVLECGHCFCCDCIREMMEQYSFGAHKYRSLKCPICRQKTLHSNISFVSTQKEDYVTQQIKVKGDHSTKVVGIVRCLLEIQRTDPGAKALVFSTWQDVLDVLATALTENDILFKSLHASHKFQKNLDTFKHDSNIKVLMLPVHSGANGLNLIEATHVLLVEPILNPAQELQAIGRVHRIGQTKPTVVHRFLVKKTIEERMHSMLQSTPMPLNSHNTDDTPLTIGDLVSLFKSQQFEEEDEDSPNTSIEQAPTVEENTDPPEPTNSGHDNTEHSGSHIPQPGASGLSTELQSETSGDTTDLPSFSTQNSTKNNANQNNECTGRAMEPQLETNESSTSIPDTQDCAEPDISQDSGCTPQTSGLSTSILRSSKPDCAEINVDQEKGCSTQNTTELQVSTRASEQVSETRDGDSKDTQPNTQPSVVIEQKQLQVVGQRDENESEHFLESVQSSEQSIDTIQYTGTEDSCQVIACADSKEIHTDDSIQIDTPQAIIKAQDLEQSSPATREQKSSDMAGLSQISKRVTLDIKTRTTEGGCQVRTGEITDHVCATDLSLGLENQDVGVIDTTDQLQAESQVEIAPRTVEQISETKSGSKPGSETTEGNSPDNGSTAGHAIGLSDVPENKQVDPEVDLNSVDA